MTNSSSSEGFFSPVLGAAYLGQFLSHLLTSLPQVPLQRDSTECGAAIP